MRQGSRRFDGSLKRAIPEWLHPFGRSVYHIMYRLYLRGEWWFVDRLDSLYRRHAALPPAKLKFRVAENSSASLFLSVGERTMANLEAALESAGLTLAGGQTALDFGCGCGRTMFWLSRRFPAVYWHGCDVDAEAVQWCGRSFPNAVFSVNTEFPPLSCASSSFDIIFGISVFTHLAEEYQKAWVPELHRVLKPGGVLLLSFYGRNLWEGLEEADAIRRGEFVFSTS
mgnify:CR=1 FL=1